MPRIHIFILLLMFICCNVWVQHKKNKKYSLYRATMGQRKSFRLSIQRLDVRSTAKISCAASRATASTSNAQTRNKYQASAYHQSHNNYTKISNLRNNVEKLTKTVLKEKQKQLTSMNQNINIFLHQPLQALRQEIKLTSSECISLRRSLASLITSSISTRFADRRFFAELQDCKIDFQLSLSTARMGVGSGVGEPWILKFDIFLLQFVAKKTFSQFRVGNI